MPARRVHPTPPQILVAELIEARAAGLDFDAAWTRGLDAVHAARWGRGRTEDRHQWRRALVAARDEFNAAYVGRSTSCARVVPLLVAALDDGSLAHESARDRVAA